MVEGMEKRICLEGSGIDNVHAFDIPKDVYSILENARR
jgi:hypothetical protein